MWRFFVSCGDRPPLLETCPQVFDEMSVPIGTFGVGDLWLVAFCRDDWAYAPVPQGSPKPVRGITPIADDVARSLRQCVEEHYGGREFMGLTWRQGERQGLSMAICGDADLAAKTWRVRPPWF